jgi:sulfate adenylyltransferase subunit 1 (EFTu-like GTPase family)
MVTAASTAQLAIILIDGRKGMLTQTKRHSYIAKLLGIKHIVVAVNKMDLIDYDEKKYQEICDTYRSFASAIELNQPEVESYFYTYISTEMVT